MTITVEEVTTTVSWSGQHDTREAWLNKAVELMRPIFAEHEETLPEVIKISVGWSKGSKGSTVGVCWPSGTAADGSVNIFIMPERDDTERNLILGTILHEMNHASDNCVSAHKGHFAKLNRKLGFLGKPTSSAEKSPELIARLDAIGEILGVYPHAALTPAAKTKVQATYMVKCECMSCGYVLRTTKKWLEMGLPTCPACGPDEAMEIEEK